MSELYLIIVILLFILAISDLVVGVSNDAVNFLNSSIGSRVASRQVIMIVASAGIFVGATFSSGMMEVARKGIFNPQFFFFAEIMIIFLAVMLTDIILLDFFNTVGLPTSTTVSIVFELLGAAVVMSLIKIAATGEEISALPEYINTSQAVLIISGIFLSVIFAFLVGAIVQFISRLIFTFRYQQKRKFLGAVWTGLAMAAMTYFLLLKGVRGASFVTEDFVDWVKTNLLFLLGISFFCWTAVMQLLALFKINIFRIVVLFGTFALAMAFAGNDLVNFIGVPIAGFESYLAWDASGQGAFDYSMEVLQEPVRTKSYLLVLAGLIMIVTLWLSKKARSVTETEVNLGRQSEGHERFSPNFLARGIVRYSRTAALYTQQVLPSIWMQQADKNFQPLPDEPADKPAFDLVRASVNLTMASILIAFATSLKLPLSTTYVSFMVAMGTSLADRAWGRDSAVYRVAGVLNVIGGWFATAFIAFTVAGIFTLLIYYFQLTAILILITLAVFFIYRSFSYHKQKAKKKESRVAFETSEEKIPFEQLFERLSQRIDHLLKTLENTYNQALQGLIQEDRKKLETATQSIRKLVDLNEDLQYELYGSVKRIQEHDSEGSRLFLKVFDFEQDIVQSAQLIVTTSNKHVNNMLSPLQTDQIQLLEKIRVTVHQYLQNVATFISNPGTGIDDFKSLISQKDQLLQSLEVALEQQIHGIKKQQYSARNSQLVFKLLLESKDMIAVAARFVKLYHRVRNTQTNLLTVDSEKTH